MPKPTTDAMLSELENKDLSSAMRRADTEHATHTSLEKAVAGAVDGETSAPLFNTHSNSYAGAQTAHLRAIRETIADLDEQLVKLHDQRNDARLVEQSIAASLEQLQKGKR